MASTKEFFLSATKRIFSNWTALKMAVEYGMGTRESALEFCSYMTEVMYMNENLDASEVGNELEDFMDEHFNTQLEDNSGEQVATELLRFYRYCLENNEQLAVEELSKLPAEQTWIMSNEAIRRPRTRGVVNDQESSSEDEEHENESMEVGEDAWTEVRTRRKR